MKLGDPRLKPGEARLAGRASASQEKLIVKPGWHGVLRMNERRIQMEDIREGVMSTGNVTCSEPELEPGGFEKWVFCGTTEGKKIKVVLGFKGDVVTLVSAMWGH